MKNKKYISGKASEMIKNDRDRINLFNKIDQMIELDWSLPQALSELKWMRKVVSTDPLAAITVGRQTLSTIKPKVFIQPLNDKSVTKKMANWNEQNLLLQLKHANKRSEFDVIGDTVESALRYGMTAVFTVPVKWQLEGTGSKWIDNKNGFMTLVENPINVYPRFSPLGLSGVLHTKVMRAEDAVAFYGDKAASLAKEIEGETTELNVIIYDYWDEHQRMTAASGATELTSVQDEIDFQHIFNNEKMELPFNPWTIKMAGTSLSRRADHQIRPAFGAIAHADAWELQNIAKTFAFSEVLGYAAAPRGKVTSYADDTLVSMIDYGDINKPVRLKPGEDYEPLNPPGIDQNLLHVLDRTSAEIDKITGIKNLGSLDPPSGTAYATVNELIKAATASLDPAKMLAEDTLGGVLGDMLKWSAHTKEDIVALGDGKKDLGRQYRLKWDHIQPDAIDVEVQLSAHVPTDRLQKINAATLLMKELDFSKEDAYRELEVANPEEIMTRRHQEVFDETVYGNELKKISAKADLEIQQQQMQMQMQAQGQMQAQQMKMQQAQQEMQGGGENAESQSQARRANGGRPQSRTGNPRKDAQSLAARGLGFDPSRGGQSPNTANPRGFTKEGSTGVDRKGNTI